MARYGEQSEGFASTVAAFEKQAAQREEMIRKEAAVQQAVSRTTRAANEQKAAIDELETVRQREQRVADVSARTTTMDTAAIEANTRARRAQAAALEVEARDRDALAAANARLAEAARVANAQRGASPFGLPAYTMSAQNRQAVEQMDRVAALEAQAAVPLALPRAGGTTQGYAGGLSGEEVRLRIERERYTMWGGATQPPPEAPQPRPGFIPPPPPPPVPPPIGPQLSDEEMARRKANIEATARGEQELTRIEGETAAAMERTRVATRESAVDMGMLSQSLRRHGALTSEFIAAAARGETTLRELGYQTVVTIGKFAGWTAAATLVYGAVRAVGELGKGATDTQNAVTGLTRFVPDLNRAQAAQQLRAVSTGLNVPIQEVGDAAGQFARLFHDIPDTMTATRQALLATKLDNITTADSFTAFTAIIQGFKLQAKDLPGLLDSINASQREFGATVKQVLPGVASAAGPFGLAAGRSPEDLQYLQALVATITRATGASGRNVGIAIGRSATRFSTQPQNVATLAGFGIDATTGNYENTINEAMRVIQAQHLGREQINTIAQAIGGPAFGARYFTALFQNIPQFQAIRTQTDPSRVRGTANEELQKVLGSIHEQAKSIGVELQNLGSQLGTSGLLNILQAALVVLRETFKVGADIVGVFNDLPKPLREAALVAAGLAGSMALMRRFNLTQRAAQIPGLGFLDSPDSRSQRLLVRGLRDQVAEATNAAEQYGRQGIRQTIEAEARRTMVSDYMGSPEFRAARNLPEHADERVRAYQQLYRLEQQAGAAEDAANAATAKVIAARQIGLRMQGELTAISEMTAAQAVATARASGLTAPGGFGTPTFASPQRFGGRRTASGIILPPGANVGPGTFDPVSVGGGAAAVSEREISARELDLQTRVRLMRASFDKNIVGLSKVGDAFQATGMFVARGVATVEEKVAGASVSGALTGMGARFTAIRAGFMRIATGLAASLGPLDALIFAFIAYEGVKSAIDADQRKLDDAMKGANYRPGDTRQAIMQRAPDQHGGLGGLINSYVDAYDTVHNFFADRGLGGGHLTSPDEALRQRENQSAQLADQINRAQAHERATGRPVQDQTLRQIGDSAQQDVNAYRTGRISLSQLQRDFAKHLTELTVSQFLSPADIRSGRAALQALQAQATGDVRSYADALKSMKLKDIEKESQAAIRDLKSFGGHGVTGGIGSARRMADQISELLKRALSGGGQDVWDALAQVQEANEQAFTQGVNDQLKMAQTLHLGSHAASDRAYGRAIHELQTNDPSVEAARRVAISAQDQVDAAQRRVNDATARVRARARATGQTGLLQAAGVGGDPFGPLTADPHAPGKALDIAKVQMDADKRALDQLKGRRDKASQALRAAIEQRDSTIAGLQQAQAQDDLAYVRAQGTLASSRINPDNTAALGKQAVKNAQDVLNFIRSHPNDFSATDLITARADLNTAKSQAAQQTQQDAVQIHQLRSQITQARERDPRAQAQTALQEAQWEYDHAKNQKDRLTAQKAIIDAQNQADQAAADYTQARFTYLESLTTDPLRQDTLKTQALRAAVRSAAPGADRMRARADLNTQLQQNVQDRVSNRESEIDFQLHMQQISKDQAIADLQALLKMHHLSKQTRQEIQQRIYDLRQSTQQEASGFDLQVGNINLPTAYDVRRAMAGVRAAANQHIRDNLSATADAARGGTAMIHDHRTTVHATVNVHVTDPKAAREVYTAIDRALKTHVRAKMRSVGKR